MLEKEYAFQLDRRHFAIVGRCRDCAAAPTRLKPENTAGVRGNRQAGESRPETQKKSRQAGS